MGHRMQKVIVLCASEHRIQACHGAAEQLCQFRQVIRGDGQKVALVGKREDMHLPFVTAGERLDGDEFLSALDDELADIQFTPNFTGFTIIERGLKRQRLVDERTENAAVMFFMVAAAVFHLGLDVVRDHRGGDDLAVRMGEKTRT